ncbi:MAG: pyridoxal-phosphate dependent enzyme, partial [Bacteroidota bacterium]
MQGLISLIGNTPLVDLSSLLPDGSRVKLFGKMEGQNPGGSVKDRAALGMISGALERGEISEATHLVEATSGNTGIALAMIAAQYGIKIT